MLQTYLLGGYTKRDNQGVSMMTFDTTSQSFGEATHLASLNNPTWITFTTDKQYFFTINKKEQGGIVVFKKNNDTFVPIAECYATTGTGCHISYHETTHTVYVSNYHEGTIDLYRFDEEQLTFITQVKHHGSSVHPNQQSPHVHMTHFNQNYSKLYACDLGTDQVVLYDIHPDGTLRLAHQTNFAAGTGPRHLTLHPTLPIAYIIGELANTITTATIDTNGHLTPIQTIATTPTEYATEAAGAAIRITQDGQFVYVSTRFYDILTVYQVQADGTLIDVQQIKTGGKIPRDFILDTTEHYVLVPHQDSDKITLFERDLTTGLLSQMDATAFAPECVNIVPA